MFSHGLKEATLSEINVTEDVQFETYLLLLKSCYKVDISKSISSFDIAQELWQLGGELYHHVTSLIIRNDDV